MLPIVPSSVFFILGFVLTLTAYLLGKYSFRLYPKIPVIVYAMLWVLALLQLSRWHYADYMLHIEPFFNHLLGYVTVALAIPLAAMRLDGLPLKPLFTLMLFASISAASSAVGLAYLFHLAQPTILAFATRAVTTPVAINIATLLHAPATIATLIVILSGVIGAAFSSIILRNINDERAAGLALGLAAHAIGTVQAWQRGPVAGRYAALGMAINAVLTSIWLPCIFFLFAK